MLLDAEIDALERRMIRLPRYDTPLTALDLVENGFGQFTAGHMPSARMSTSTVAFFMRKTWTDDCAHLGCITFDPADPRLDILVKVFSVAVDLASSPFPRGSERQRPMIRLCARGIYSDRGCFTIDRTSGLDPMALGLRIRDLLGPDWAAIANRFEGRPSGDMGKLTVNGLVVMAGFMGSRDLPSSHAAMMKYAEFNLLKEELANLRKTGVDTCTTEPT
ncbi:hypothetical protein ACOI1H_16425 [Loktanella sp. DJP18]|uniref:hypothetical protein n=1 Tax=Loktanella sp. DJP18 TaxID=3409788 RepID=UPI003BB5E288